MRISNVLLLVVGLVLIAAGPQADEKNAAKSDQNMLQGVWKLVKCEAEGKIVDNKKMQEGVDLCRITFDGDRMKNFAASPEVGFDHPFELDTTAKPKRITITSEGPDGELKFLGIYSLHDDELKLCLNVDGKSDKRPTDFSTKKGEPFVLSTYKREKQD